MNNKYWDGVNAGIIFALKSPEEAEKYVNRIYALRNLQRKLLMVYQNLYQITLLQRRIKMIIIVEGIDRVGKTTLANKIKKEINIPYFKSMATKSQIDRINNEDETMKSINTVRLCNLLNAYVVIDRFHLSDYGNIERGYDKKISEENFFKIEKYLKEQKAIIILVKPVDINKSSQEHGKNLIEYENLFEEIYEKSINEKIYCDYNSFDFAINYIREKIKKDG